jgi:predicted component of type VI protein secretion system
MNTPRTYAAKIKSGFAAIPDGFYDHARGLETELATLTAERDQLRADRTYNHECINRLAAATGTLGENSEKVVDVVLSTIDQLRARAERAEAELAKYLSACPASPTEEERKRCQQWWAISGRSP